MNNEREFLFGQSYRDLTPITISSVLVSRSWQKPKPKCQISSSKPMFSPPSQETSPLQCHIVVLLSQQCLVYQRHIVGSAPACLPPLQWQFRSQRKEDQQFHQIWTQVHHESVSVLWLPPKCSTTKCRIENPLLSSTTMIWATQIFKEVNRESCSSWDWGTLVTRP